MENKNFPKRKPTRLKYYDYSQPDAYFVTICTKDKINILSEINVGEGLRALPKRKTKFIAQTPINAIPSHNGK